MLGLTRASGSDVRQATDRFHRPWDCPKMQFHPVRWAPRLTPRFSAALLLTFALTNVLKVSGRVISDQFGVNLLAA